MTTMVRCGLRMLCGVGSASDDGVASTPSGADEVATIWGTEGDMGSPGNG